MRYDFRRRLLALSDQQRRNTVLVPDGTPFDSTRLGVDFYYLACEMKGRYGLTDEQTMCTFFSDGAAAYLLTMPNIHWFWNVVQATVVDCQRQDGASLITEQEVRNAVGALRRELAGRFDLSLQVSDLTPGQLCARLLAGVILAQGPLSEAATIRFNPLFAPEAQGC